MGEAFIFGSGGGATVEHIVMTDAESHTFQLTNPKRTHCKVFGSINSSEYTGNSGGIWDSFDGTYRLYGTQYVAYSRDGSRNITAGNVNWNYTESTEFNEDITITRDDGSITIELDPSHPYFKDYQEGYDSGWDEYYTKLSRTNTIDIYVVDYD